MSNANEDAGSSQRPAMLVAMLYIIMLSWQLQ